MGLLLWITLLAIGFIIFYWKRVYDFIRIRRKLYIEIDKLDGPPSFPLIGTVFLFKWTAEGNFIWN